MPCCGNDSPQTQDLLCWGQPARFPYWNDFLGPWCQPLHLTSLWISFAMQLSTSRARILILLILGIQEDLFLFMTWIWLFGQKCISLSVVSTIAKPSSTNATPPVGSRNEEYGWGVEKKEEGLLLTSCANYVETLISRFQWCGMHQISWNKWSNVKLPKVNAH
jgi:hypothetical protein